MKRGYRYREVLAAAAELAGEKGWNCITMKDVAERADTTKGVVKGHFPAIISMRVAALVAYAKQLRGHSAPLESIWR